MKSEIKLVRWQCLEMRPSDASDTEWGWTRTAPQPRWQCKRQHQTALPRAHGDNRGAGTKCHLQDVTALSIHPIKLIGMDRTKKKPVSNCYLRKGTLSGIHSRLV